MACSKGKRPNKQRSSCEECQYPTYFNVSQGACIKCDAGKQRNASSATTPCEICAKGRSDHDLDPTTACKACNANEYFELTRGRRMARCTECPHLKVVLKDKSGCACDNAKRRYNATQRAFTCVPEGATFAVRRADFRDMALEMDETDCATMKQDASRPCVVLRANNGAAAPRPVVLPSFGVSQTALASVRAGEAGGAGEAAKAGASARGIAVFACPGTTKSFNPCPNFNGTLTCAAGHTGPL